MRKRKRPRNNIDSVGVDLETFANTYVVTRPNGKVRDCPQSRVVTVTPGSKHGQYNTNGNVTATPLETDLDQVIIPKKHGFLKDKKSCSLARRRTSP
jgi:hypothetical protein